MTTKKELTKAEEQVMQAIWKVERGFAKDILECMNEPKPAYNTVLTVIRVLVQKGFVEFETYGKSNQYFATISKDDYSMEQLKKLRKNYFNNSNKKMLSFFVKENKMDVNELDEIFKLIQDEDE